MSVISIKGVKKYFQMGQETIKALDGVDLEIEQGEFVAITGSSGSGKSTLMNVLGCLDKPDSGEYVLDGQAVSELDEGQLAQIRNEKIGFVFQSFHLLSRHNTLQNVTLPTHYAQSGRSHYKPEDLLKLVGLEDRSGHTPPELSGGQRQRVAIARALINEPAILLADEPTGNLDSKTSKEILSLLKNLNSQGVTIILVTHDPKVARQAGRVVEFSDGKVFQDTRQESSAKGEASSIDLNSQPKKGSFLSNLFSIVFSGLIGTKLRTSLSVLGVIIGVAAVITMIGLGQGASASVTESIGAMGTNLLMVRSGAGRRGLVRGGNVQTLTSDDAKAIEEKIPGLLAVAPESSGQAQVKYFNNNSNVGIVGSNADYFLARNYKLDYGRLLNQSDVDNSRLVCVLGADTAEELFAGAPAIGERIRIKGKSFEVIGVLQAKGQGGWSNPDEVIVVPLSTAQRKLFGVRHVRAIYLSIEKQEEMSQIEQDVSQLLRQRHRLGPEDEDDFRIRNQQELLQTMGNVANTFALLLAGVAVVSLLVGGIGIMNIMLVSVSERTKEIGLLKSLGATRFHIMQQFLLESLTICFLGGVLGILAGHAAAFMTGSLTSWKVVIPGYAYIVSFSFCVFIGVVFGAYPALSASRLDPIVALRHE